jgi:hypothetical protein
MIYLYDLERGIAKIAKKLGIDYADAVASIDMLICYIITHHFYRLDLIFIKDIAYLLLLVS